MSEITPLIQDYIVDFSSNNNFFFVKGVQGDGYGVRYARISLSNNGQPYIIDKESVRAVIIGTKSDNNEICNECEIIDSSTIQFELTQQMLAVPGKGNYSIAIMSTTTNQMLKSFPFIIFSNQSTFDVGYITSSNEFTLLISKINQVDSLSDEVKLVVSNAELVINECESKTELCIQATDAANIAIKELRELEGEVKSSENQRDVAEMQRNETFQSLKENSEEATTNAITATSDIRELEESIKESESNRETAEKNREETFLSSVKASETATQNAITAKENAENATSDAKNATIEVQKRIQEYDSLNVSESVSDVIEAMNNTISATENVNEAILNAETATQNAIKATNGCKEALTEIQDKLGIDDDKESLTTTWSSIKISEKIDENIENSKEWSLRYRMQNITISPDDWIDKVIYVKNEKITENSIVDIYYNNSSFTAVYDLDIVYTQGNGYLCFTSSYIPTENIMIDTILIENYFNDSESQIAGNV